MPEPRVDETGDRPDWQQSCLSFTVSGDWAHFRRIEGNVVKRTYRIMPRTTVAGMIAAVLGIDRDGYYEIFGEDSSRIAIEPVSEIWTMNMPKISLDTNKGALEKKTKGGLKARFAGGGGDQQRYNYEMLVDPAYRIDVSLKNRDVYEKLRRYLETGKSHYTPSLGVSECLASIDYHGEFDVEEIVTEEQLAVSSAVPDREPVIEPGVSYASERSPAYMEVYDEYDGFSKRRTMGFTSYSFREDAEDVLVSGGPTSRVDDRLVVFE